MMWLRLFFVLILFTIQTMSYSTHDTLVFFDFISCKSYSAANDPLGYDEKYQKWAELVEKLPPDSDGTRWGIYHMDDEKTLGICKRAYGKVRQELICRHESLNFFPLSGARFISVNDERGNLLWFKCVDGCSKNVPKRVYDEGYESEEDDPNFIALQRAFKNFESKCLNRSLRKP